MRFEGTNRQSNFNIMRPWQSIVANHDATRATSDGEGKAGNRARHFAPLQRFVLNSKHSQVKSESTLKVKAILQLAAFLEIFAGKIQIKFASQSSHFPNHYRGFSSKTAIRKNTRSSITFLDDPCASWTIIHNNESK